MKAKLALLLLVLGGRANPPAFAAESSLVARIAPPGYALRHWGTGDGLPAGTIRDVQQGPDGYLWLATNGGLVRFDGHRFTVFDHKNSGLLNPRLASVTFTSRGGMRVRAEDESAMESPSTDPPRFVPLPGASALLSQAIEDSEGRSWTVCHFEGVGLACRISADGSMIVTQRVTWARFVRDGKGDIWARLATGEAGRLDGKVFRPHGSRQSLNHLLVIPSRREVLISRESEGRIELLDSSGRVFTRYEPRPGWTPRLVDRFGNVWMATADAIVALRPDGSEVFSKSFPFGTNLVVMTEDEEGDVWMGTETDGLYRASPTPFHVYDEKAGVQESSVAEFRPYVDGSMLLLTWRAGLQLLRNGRAEATPPLIHYRDRRGTIWRWGGSRIEKGTEEVLS